MNIEWMHQLHKGDLYFGGEPFIQYDGCIVFFFNRIWKLHSDITALFFNKGAVLSEKTIDTSLIKVSIERHWRAFVDNNQLYLVVNDNKCIDFTHHPQIIQMPVDIAKKYHDAIPPELHYVNDSFFFGDIEIRHKGERSFNAINMRTEKVIWSMKQNAYLYTEIESHEGIIYFGTSGNGGGFYGYRLCDGTQTCFLKTHGTERYIWNGENVILGNLKDELSIFSPRDNNEIETLKLPGKVTPGSSLAQINGKIYTIAYNKPYTPDVIPIICCVGL